MSVIVIWVDGADITRDVMLGSTMFAQAVNGRAGQFRMQVKDDEHVYAFTSGKRVTLDIDGLRTFDGYAHRVTHKYAFPVDRVIDTTQTPRIWELEGPDVNILFQKRFIYDQDSPNQELPTWPAGTQDNTIILDMVANQLALAGDDISTAGVTHVGSPNPDHAGYIANIGQPWGAAMSAVAMYPGAVWYLAPDRTLVYEDDSTANAPFILTDVPVIPGTPAIPGGSATITDTFDRTATNSWGTGNLGAWTIYSDPSHFSVTSGQGKIISSSGTKYVDVELLAAPVQASDFITFECSFSWDTIAASNYVDLYLYAEGFASHYIDLYVYKTSVGNPELNLALWNNDTLTFDSSSIDLGAIFVANGTVHMKFDYRKSTGAVRGKYWNDGSAEPGWQLEMTASFATMTNVGVEISVNHNAFPSGPGWFFNDVSITYDSEGTPEVPPEIVGVGYSGFQWTEDGSKMVNDALVWGAGTGSSTPVHANIEDATSISTHGRWQLPGYWRSDVYRQTTATQIANSIVYGSPQNLHGAKDPSVAVRCRIKEPGLTAGMKVRVVNNVFTDEKVLPIRRMVVTFPTPTDVLYDLELSQELDQPWSMAEFLWRFPPPGGGGTWEPPVFPPFPQPDPTGECTDAICGITDTFTRTVSGGWGVADAGIAWDIDVGSVSVDGSSGVMTITNPGYQAYASLVFSPVSTLNATVIAHLGQDFIAASEPNGGAPGTFLQSWTGKDASGFGGYVYWEIGKLGGGYYLYTQSPQPPLYLESTTYLSSFNPTDPFNIHWEATGPGTVSCWVWQGGAMPSTPTATCETTSTWIADRLDIGAVGYVVPSPHYFYIDNIDIAGVNACSEVQFDNFNRTTASGWGTSDAGDTWNIRGPGIATKRNVENGYGKIEQGAGTFDVGQAGVQIFDSSSGPGRWKDESFSLTTRIKIEAATSGHPASAGFYFDQTFTPFGRTGFAIVNSPSQITLFRSQTSGSNSFSTPYTLTPGAHYMIKYERTGTSHRVKIWADGATEPGTWTLEDGGIDWGGADYFMILHQRNAGFVDWKVWYDYIEFDYDGKPCYSGICTGDVSLDEFDRTVTGGWGTMTFGGWVWTTGTGANGTIAVTGDYGRITLDWPSASTGAFSAEVTSPDADAGPWSYDSWTMLSRFRMTGGLPTGLTFQISNLAITEGDEVFLRPNHDTAGSGPGSQAAFAFDPNVWYLVKWDYQFGTINRFKVWIDGTSEPGWFAAEIPTSISRAQPLRFKVFADWPSQTGVRTIDWDYIRFPDCGDVGGEDVPGSPQAYAYGCEEPDQINAIEFRLQYTYIAGTTEAWRNGVLQRRGIDYTESDPVTGLITFATSIPGTDTIWVCYHAGGTIQSGGFPV